VREIRLYDSLSRELVPVSAGDAIRVEVRTSPIVVDGGVDVASTRPLVLFSFLERYLQREGFATKFLFDSPSDGDILYELSELEPLDATDSPDSPDSLDSSSAHGEHDVDRRGELDAERDPDLNGKHGAGHDADTDVELDAERDGDDGYDSGSDTGMSLLEVSRSDVDRWVNICFGASRDGVEPEPVCADERILLSDALKHFGHPAVALYLLGTHYSLPLGDALTGLATGSKNASRIREAFERLVPDQPSPPDMRHHMEAFRDALANDLDTPLAFVIMFEWLLEAERRGGDVGDHDLRVMLEVLELDGLAAPVG
jgi:hypothetical protein